MPEDKPKVKEEIVSKKEKTQKYWFIGITIVLLLIILFLISLTIKELGNFFSKNWGLVIIFFLTAGAIIAAIFVLLKRREQPDSILKVIDEITFKEARLSGTIIDPVNILVAETAPDVFLVEFENVDFNDGAPPKRRVYEINRKTKEYYPTARGAIIDAIRNKEKSEFYRSFLAKEKAEKQLSEKLESMGLTKEKIEE